MKLIDGKAASTALRETLRQKIETLEQEGITPGLAVIIVGSDPASRVYVNNKKRACAELGIYSEEYALSGETTQRELIELVQKLNKKPDIDGILVQLPLPEQIDEQAVIEAIDPDKDVDAFNVRNVGKVMVGEYKFVPCTPAGILELLDQNGIDVAGKECVVVGRSNIVGKPMAMLLLQRNGTVTVCHSKTRNLKEVCKRADILVAAIGKAKFFTADYIKPGATVIDVGMNRDEAGRLCGDVDFASVSEIAGAITPVPGGVGPMTITMLMKNTISAALPDQA